MFNLVPETFLFPAIGVYCKSLHPPRLPNQEPFTFTNVPRRPFSGSLCVLRGPNFAFQVPGCGLRVQHFAFRIPGF